MRRLLWPLLQIVMAVGALGFGLQWLLRLFGQRRTVFQVTYWRGVYLLIWPLASLCVGLPLVGPLVTGRVTAWEAALFGVLAVAVLSVALPSFVLHAQYHRHNRRTTLLFDPKANVLEVYEGAYPVTFAQHEVARVEYHVCRSPRVFWSSYEFLRLVLADGRVITLTSLLLKLTPLAEFLRNTNLEHRRRWFCWV